MEALDYQMNVVRNSEARCLMVTSNIPDIFSAGADLKERKGMNSTEEIESFVDSLRNTFHKLQTLEIPVIAAINGHALGGGLELALSCDLRICSPSAKLGLPETKLAIFPAYSFLLTISASGSQMLPRIVGIAKAKELIFSGKVISGQEAYNIGLVNSVSENPEEESMKIAQQICENGPLGIKCAKALINIGAQLPLY